MDTQSDPSATRTRRNLLKAGAKVAGVGVVAALAALRPRKALAAPPCFLRGTHIRTTDGECKVEDLKVGDLLTTEFGGVQPIKWIGRYAYRRSNLSKPWVSDYLPVRVARSAIAPNEPSRDLLVTPGHAFFIDGVLIPIGSLVNGTTIKIDPSTDSEELEFFHIKLESHDVIYAEGTRCESLLMVGEVANNFAEYYRLYGVPTETEAPCAPLLSYNGGRSEVKSRLRSAASPWVDRRTPLDVIRDRLEERGIALTRGKVDA